MREAILALSNPKLNSYFDECRLYGCNKPAVSGGVCCSTNHGVKVRDILKDLRAYKNELMPLSNWYFGYGPGNLSLEELEYYSRFIN